MLSDTEILRLYRDPTFPAAFSGMRNFQTYLKTELNEDVPLTKLLSIFKKEPFYVVSQRQITRFPRRKYDVKSFGELVQADLGQLYPYDGFRYFLVLVDIFSHRVWAEPLKSKNTKDVKSAFTKIFHSIQPEINGCKIHFYGIKSPISHISTDQGLEFKSLKKYFESQGILLTFKYGKTKASFAEWFIHLIKRKLYMMMRSELNDNWPKYLPLVINLLNSRKLPQLGNLMPKNVNSMADDSIVRNEQEKVNVPVYSQPDWKTQNQNQKAYEKSKHPYQVGQYVYVDEKKAVFDKSFVSNVRFTYYINYVISLRNFYASRMLSTKQIFLFT